MTEEGEPVAYARFGPDSDIYMYAHIGGGFECCGCLLTVNKHGEPLSSFWCEDRVEMINHLHEHQESGHAVPYQAVLRLVKEIQGEPFKTEVQQALEQFKERHEAKP